jgi:F420 biosynthesis protein FbiB-like protein
MKGGSEALDVILSRRSIREFSPKALPKVVVDSLLEAGRRAPSPHNTQPWLFVVISKKNEKEVLAASMRDAYLAHLRAIRDAESREKADRAYRRSCSAPLILLLCLDRGQLRPQPIGSRRRREWIMGTQGVAAAAENVLLAAHAQGLGGCWRGAPIFCGPAIRHTLGLPSSSEPQVLLEIGYPAKGPRRKRLKAKDRVVWYGLRRG